MRFHDSSRLLTMNESIQRSFCQYLPPAMSALNTATWILAATALAGFQRCVGFVLHGDFETGCGCAEVLGENVKASGLY